MLTYDALIAQAKIRNMPHTKIRGVLREYLQVLILKEIYRLDAGRKLYFTGGTYLRLVHGLKRFSEDLDFNTVALDKSGFENLLAAAKRELGRTGLAANLKFNHFGSVYSSKLIFPEIEKNYNVVSKYSKKEGIAIKVETNKSKWDIPCETQLITGFGETYPAVCTNKGILFADKIDALMKKRRARHIYDIIFMLSNKYPVDGDFLKLLGIMKEPLEAIADAIKRFSKNDLKTQAEILRPFLFDEKEADLVANAGEIIPPLLEKYTKN